MPYNTLTVTEFGLRDTKRFAVCLTQILIRVMALSVWKTMHLEQDAWAFVNLSVEPHDVAELGSIYLHIRCSVSPPGNHQHLIFSPIVQVQLMIC